jgi:Tol biopolymer transport system component
VFRAFYLKRKGAARKAWKVDVTQIGVRRMWRLAAALVLLLTCAPAAVHAQDFGRNKVQYRSFDFQIIKTEHFDLYYYPQEAEAALLVSRMAERWHSRLSRFFGHELRGRQPLILYAAGSHFRQTNAVEGLIGEGTGGVTEALKRRVVLPMAGSLAETDHVLGHELVHAFQFDLTGVDPRDGVASAPGILAFPLWFVEGMAEYLSIGPVDPQTAMWMRDAALREKLPHIRDLDDWKYFPYRWGHAFWAYVGAKYGDRTVASLVRSAANPRNDLVGLARQLGTDPDTLTREWHDAIRESTRAVADDVASISSTSRLIIGSHNGGGRFNVGARVSPDGRQVAFFSERDRFSVELFLADVESGRITRKLSKAATDPHFDSLEFLNSAGAWHPDGRTLALTAVRAGRPVVALVDTQSGDVKREVKLTGLDDALQPTFAPDGKSLVLSGNAGGLFDLYRVWLDTGRLERLTADPFADLEPTFTPDGRSIVFVTERFTTATATLQPGSLRMARLDLGTSAVRLIPAFLAGKHISPQVSADGRHVTFIADPDGVSNLYRIAIDGGPIERLTSVATGIAGITASSPALSQSSSGRLVFSVFEEDGQAIYAIDPSQVVALVPAEPGRRAAVLPGRSVAGGDVDRLLTDYARGLPAIAPALSGGRYKAGLSLDEIGQPTVSAGISEYGGYVAGGLSATFSDMLGDRSLGVAGQVGGSLADFGGQLTYINRRHRWNWIAAIEQLPYRVGYLSLTEDTAAGEILLTETIARETDRGAFGAAVYPLSPATRLEVSGGVRSQSFSRELRTRVYSSETLLLMDRRTTKLPTANPLYLGEVSAAIVKDTSYFGATAPVYGSRARLEFGRTAGTLQYSTLVADWRRYFMPVRPITFALRGMHYGRYGASSEHPQLADIYAGYPEFVHGYGIGSFSAQECLQSNTGRDCSVFQNLIGSRLLVANAEVRAPLKGLFSGELEYGRIPVDIAAFADFGLMWTASDLPSLSGGTRRPVRSIGGAVRFNAFGILVLELAVSHPFDRVDRGLQWQFGIRQGF